MPIVPPTPSPPPQCKPGTLACPCQVGERGEQGLCDNGLRCHTVGVANICVPTVVPTGPTPITLPPTPTPKANCVLGSPGCPCRFNTDVGELCDNGLRCLGGAGSGICVRDVVPTGATPTTTQSSTTIATGSITPCQSFNRCDQCVDTTLHPNNKCVYCNYACQEANMPCSDEMVALTPSQCPGYENVL
jgi:hypothetical protein